MEQFEIESPELYRIIFQEDGVMSVTADCNRASLPDTDEDGVLTVESGPVTLEFCGPESRSEQFVGYPNYAAGYFFDDGGSLFIDLFADGGTLEFASTEEQP